ncbi:MAG TPA: hypothetical protein VGE80_06235, partial [Schlesneria sp.]
MLDRRQIPHREHGEVEMVTGLRFLTVTLMVLALAHPGMAQVGGGAGGTGGLGGGFGGGFGGLGGGGNNQN